MASAANDTPARVGFPLRLLGGGVVGLGVVFASRAVRHVPEEPWRWSAVLILFALGTALGGLALAGRRVAVRGLVRGVSIGITLVFLSGLVLLRRQILDAVLPGVPRSDVELRAAIEGWVVLLAWLALAAGHVAAGLAVVPGRRRPRSPGIVRAGEPRCDHAGHPV